MFLQLLQLLLISLGFQNAPRRDNPPASLYRVNEPKPLVFSHPLLLMVVMTVGIILFVAVVICFMPGTESGVYYNHPLY